MPASFVSGSRATKSYAGVLAAAADDEDRASVADGAATRASGSKSRTPCACRFAYTSTDGSRRRRAGSLVIPRAMPSSASCDIEAGQGRSRGGCDGRGKPSTLEPPNDGWFLGDRRQPPSGEALRPLQALRQSAAQNRYLPRSRRPSASRRRSAQSRSRSATTLLRCSARTRSSSTSLISTVSSPRPRPARSRARRLSGPWRPVHRGAGRQRRAPLVRVSILRALSTRSHWQERESWRLWLTNRLALALVAAHRDGGSLEPWQYALGAPRARGHRRGDMDSARRSLG